MNTEVSTLAVGLGKYWGHAARWVLLAALLLPPVVCELVLAIAPSRVVYALYAVTAAVIQYRAFVLPLKRQVGPLLALVAALLTLHLVQWNSRKVFLAEFERIEMGMSAERVQAIMAPVSIAPERQTDLSQRGYRHSDAPRFDSDIGLVRFADGRVSATEFLPD